MTPSVLLVTLLATDPTPPVVGRPLDFSGAVGGPFAVTLAADPTSLAAEEPLTLTLRVTGPGNLADLRRPDLAPFDALFAIDPLDEAVVPGGREFRYRLRPRTAGVTEVPRYKFVYFNPRLPTNLGYQTAYGAAVPLTVTAKSPPARPTEVPGWMAQEPDWDEFIPPVPFWLARLLSFLGFQRDAATPPWQRACELAILLALPPLACAAGWVLWRRRYPDAARLAARHRSRAASVALRALRGRGDDPAAHVAAALTEYLHRRGELPAARATPAEVESHWRASADHRALRSDTVAVLRRCDAARFSRAEVAAPSPEEVSQLVLAWEAVR